MQIILTSKEMDEAVHLWLSNQGFTSDRFSISTRTIAGRTDSGIGSRVEVTLEPKPSKLSTLPETTAPLSAMDIQIATGVASSTRRFGQGHADE